MDNERAGRELSTAAGKAARDRVPLDSHREFKPAPGRDPVALPDRQHLLGQRLMQAASDIFLGWQRTTVSGLGRTDYYVRQLRDWKYSAPIERMGPGEMADYGELCGWTLARAHARTGDRFAIAAYLGGSGKFEQAVADFGVSYADQTERDHAALADAAASGLVEARTGV
jgi:hypothetical protein